jgi:hypothetical protein
MCCCGGLDIQGAEGIFSGIFHDFYLFVSIFGGKPEVKTQPYGKLFKYS